MKTYLDLPHELQALVDERHAKVNADPKVVAAFAARDAARAAVIDARNAARAEAMARMFKKGKLK